MLSKIDTLNWDALDPNEPLIDPDVQPVNVRRLAAQIVMQAIRDMLAKSSLKDRVEAFLWLTGPECEAWRDAAGAENLNPYVVLPRLREVKRLLKRSA